MRSGPKKYNLYVIHDRGPQSHGLVAVLQAYPGFEFCDLSIADARLADGSREKVAALARKRIREADAVLVLTAPAGSRSAWIKFQLDAAKACGARIVGVTPKGSAVSPLVRTHAARIVAWEAGAGAIVGAILSRRAEPVATPAPKAPMTEPKPAPAAKPRSATAPVVAKAAPDVARPSSTEKSGSLWGRLFGRRTASAF